MPLTRDLLINLMRGRHAPICADCLADKINRTHPGVTFSAVYDAWLDIELRQDLPIRHGECPDCEKPNFLMWPRAGSKRAP
jgi:hypothetical protein